MLRDLTFAAAILPTTMLRSVRHRTDIAALGSYSCFAAFHRLLTYQSDMDYNHRGLIGWRLIAGNRLQRGSSQATRRCAA